MKICSNESLSIILGEFRFIVIDYSQTKRNRNTSVINTLLGECNNFSLVEGLPIFLKLTTLKREIKLLFPVKFSKA